MNSLIKNVFGFDPFAANLRAMEDLVKSAYPKYDLIRNEDGSFSLELAVAGFKKENLSVFLKNGTLLIEGKTLRDACTYIHKGISTRPFKLMFPISVDWKLKQVNLMDGILRVSFVTEAEEAQKVEIQETSEPAKLTQEIKND